MSQGTVGGPLGGHQGALGGAPPLRGSREAFRGSDKLPESKGPTKAGRPFCIKRQEAAAAVTVAATAAARAAATAATARPAATIEAAAAAAGPAAPAAVAAAPARNGPIHASASAARYAAPVVQPGRFAGILKVLGATLSQGPLLHELQRPTKLDTKNSSSNSSSSSSSTSWLVPSLPLQRQHLVELGSGSIHSPLSREPFLWGPFPFSFPKLPVGDPCAGLPPLSIPAVAPLEGPPPSSGRTSPFSEPPLGAPRGAPLGAPLSSGVCEGPPPEYRCNKVRNDKRHRKRAFVHRGFWGRQRRLQLKHERLRLAFAYQGVDLLKLKSLRWGEVSKGPWGSAIGG
ncbi:hypothetical protein ACSSS7_004580 [Eimeria intestinalis]